jgi:hypothetical protein
VNPIIIRLTLCAAILTLCACGNTGKAAPDTGTQLPAPSTLAGKALAWAGGYIPPSNFEDQGYPHNRVLAGVGDAGATFRSFNTGAALENWAYCMYRTALPGETLEVSLEWGEHVPPVNHFFIGLADLQTDSWDWYLIPPGPLSIPDLTPYKAGDGTCLFALILVGTEDGLLTTADLDAIRMRSERASGWEFAKVTETVGATDFGLLEYQGQPFVTHTTSTASPEAVNYSAFVPTGDWGVESNWSEHAFPSITGHQFNSAWLVQGDSIYLATFDETGQEFVFLEGDSLAGPWEEMRTAVDYSPLPFPMKPYLGTVGGEPVLTFKIPIESGNPDSDYEYAGYGYRDQTGWHLSLAQFMGYQGNLAHYTQAVDVAGRPLFLYSYNEAPDGYGIFYSYADTATPAAESDWQHGRITSVTVDDFRTGLRLDTLNGQPFGFTGKTQFTASPEVRLLYLPGSDPASANWTVHICDYWDFSAVYAQDFAVVQDKPSVLLANADFVAAPDAIDLDCQLGNTSAPNDAAGWSNLPVSDVGTTIVDFAEIAGQPAVLLLQAIYAVDDTKHYKIVYGSYVP